MPTPIAETIAALTPMEWRIILLASLILIGFWVVLAINSWARRLALGDRSAGARRKTAPGPDAWTESGRRFRFDAPSQADDDSADADDEEPDDEDEDDPDRN
ncbi:hypothetical protein HED60_00335 [Planctomycetales bacterium ZRK34]|nr:hypothetical protein HED60_00335 [Planctomycetales bacterium ZRK34]